MIILYAKIVNVAHPHDNYILFVFLSSVICHVIILIFAAFAIKCRTPVRQAYVSILQTTHIIQIHTIDMLDDLYAYKVL